MARLEKGKEGGKKFWILGALPKLFLYLCFCAEKGRRWGEGHGSNEPQKGRYLQMPFLHFYDQFAAAAIVGVSFSLPHVDKA